jgi:tetratricopeptide (TPR) repeat protein
MLSARSDDRRPWRGVLARSLLALVVSPNGQPALAQNSQEWVGKQVVTKSGATLRVGKQVVDNENLANARGGLTNINRLYRVEQVNGNWLWLQDVNSVTAGWATADAVIPYDQAIDYFTSEIRANPNNTVAYNRRGHIWRDQHELNRAIADYGEVIRLDPASAIGWCNRGSVWSLKDQYDKAITDFSEAIRLDAAYAPAYNNRGQAWLAKNAIDKAVADFSEAIRLDPNDATAYTARGNAWCDKDEYDKAVADYGEAIRVDPKHALAYISRGNVWYGRKDYDKAVVDYGEAIRLDPKGRGAYFNRAVAQVILHRAEAASGFKAVFDLQGGKGALATYAVILGHVAARLAGDPAQAKAFLEGTPGKLDSSAWPYPLVKLLRGEIDEPALLSGAVADDEKTDARCFLGLDQLINDHKDKALAHFRWVRDHGDPTSVFHVIALAELERLEKPEAKSPPGRN